MGYGDEIMATAEAREAKKKFPNAKIVIGDGKKTYPSIIYLNNPNIYQGEISPTHNDEYIWVKNYIGHRPYILGHDKIFKLPNNMILIGCYHPSPRNVNTKVITPLMINSLFKKAKKFSTL